MMHPSEIRLSWQTRLIHGWRATGLVLVAFALFVGLLVVNASARHAPPWLVVLLGVAGLLALLLRLHRLPWVSYPVRIDVSDRGIEIREQHYLWTDLSTFRYDTNSALVTNLILRFREKRKVNLMVANMVTNDTWQLGKIVQFIREKISDQSLPATDDYAHPVWQGTAWLSLLTVPALWLWAIYTGQEIRPLLAPFLVWTGTAVSFWAMVRRR